MLTMSHEEHVKDRRFYRSNEQSYRHHERGRQHFQSKKKNTHKSHNNNHWKRNEDSMHKSKMVTPLKRRRIHFDRVQNSRFESNSNSSPFRKRDTEHKTPTVQMTSTLKHGSKISLKDQYDPNCKTASNSKNNTQDLHSTSHQSWHQYRSNHSKSDPNSKTDDYDDSYLPSFSCEKNTGQATSNNIYELPKLDPKNPDHAHKIIKRRKMISYGKNTIGYDEYLKKVPKHTRIPRSAQHPQTPDPTIDIPWKRFHGLVKAWRKSLHMYDPSDLMSGNCQSTQKPISTQKNSHPKSIQESEIQQATARGLQVDFSCEISSGCNPPSPSGSMAGELNRLEIEKKEPENKIKKYSWYQSSDEEDEFDKMIVDDNDSDDDIL